MNIKIAEQPNEPANELFSKRRKTMVDFVIGWSSFGRPVSLWTSTFIIFLYTLLIALIIDAVSGELIPLYTLAHRLPSAWVIWVLFNLFACTACMTLSNDFCHRVLAVLHDCVINRVDSQSTLEEIRSWVYMVTSRRILVILSLFSVGILISVFVSKIFDKIVNQFTGVTLGMVGSLALTPFIIEGTIFMGFILALLNLSVRMGRFELKLFEADPAGSEVIARLSGLFGSFLYLIAAYGAVQTFSIVMSGLMNYVLILALIFWVPIVTIFVSYQLSLSKIIQRTKWKTLNAIQKKITEVQTTDFLPKRDEQESLLWLLNYHERVKTTRNSALDFGSGLSFINSMLIPLIALILGNMDVVIKLFNQEP